MNQTSTTAGASKRQQHSPTPARNLGSISAAADRLRCSPRTVRRLIGEGDLAAYRVGKRMLRVDLDEVDALLRRVPTAEATG